MHDADCYNTMILVPRPLPRFSAGATLKMWEWPGDELTCGSAVNFVVRGRIIANRCEEERCNGSYPNCVQLYGSYSYSGNYLLSSNTCLWTVPSSSCEIVGKYEQYLCECPCIIDGVVGSLVVLWWRCVILHHVVWSSLL